MASSFYVMKSHLTGTLYDPNGLFIVCQIKLENIAFYFGTLQRNKSLCLMDSSEACSSVPLPPPSAETSGFMLTDVPQFAYNIKTKCAQNMFNIHGVFHFH